MNIKYPGDFGRLVILDLRHEIATLNHMFEKYPEYRATTFLFRNIRVLMITPPGTLPTGTKLALASQFSLTAAHLARGVIAWFSTGSEVVGSVQDVSLFSTTRVSC